MSIADGIGISGLAALSEHELLKMFGAFCCKVFEYRDSIISPMAEMGLETAGTTGAEAGTEPESATNSDSGNSKSPSNNGAKAATTATTTAATTAAAESPELESIKAAEAAAKDVVQHQEKFRVIHRSIALFIKSMMDSEKMAAFQKSSKEVIYAMAAIADEVFLNMDWEGKHFWEEHMLETKFFDSQVAGDEIFYRIAEVVNQKDAIGTEKAEIYLNMLMLDFKGRFRGTDDENIEINMYKNKLFNFITRRNREEILNSASRIFQKQYDYTMPTVRRKLLPDGGIVTYMATCFLIIFLGVSTIVWLIETMGLSALLNDISSIVLVEH